MSISSESRSPVARSAGIVQTMRNHPLVSFFVLAYAVSWVLWSPVVFFGLPAFSPATHAPSWYILPGIAIGVTGSAFLMTALTQGTAGVLRLLRRLVLWRVGLGWYAVAVLLIPLTEILVAAALGTPGALGALSPAALLLYPAAYAAHFFFGPLFEESGWRGFALPRMQYRHGPLWGTLLLGIIWSAWHFFLYVPVWFQGGSVVGGLLGTGQFVVTTTSMTFIFTWLFNNTQASLLLSILLHGSVDGTATYMQVLADKGLISANAAGNSIGLGVLIGCVVWALLLTAVTRGRLSYPRYERQAEPLDLRPFSNSRRLGHDGERKRRSRFRTKPDQRCASL